MAKLTRHLVRLIQSLPRGFIQKAIPARATVAGLLTLALWSMSGGAHAIAIEVNPNNQSVGLGLAVSVDVDIRDLGLSTAPSVGGFDLTVDFDSALLDLTGVTFGTGLDLGLFGSFQSTSGVAPPVDIFELSFETASDLNNQQPDNFTLFTLNFDTLATGTSAVALSLNALSDADGAPLSTDLVNGSITIVDAVGVPAPATLALLGLGLCLVAYRRRPSLCRP